MYNYLLDRLPTEYEGYLIRTDYRIGMQIDMCLSDRSFPEEDRVLNALYLLYGNGIPDDFIIAYKGLVWFMSCGEKELTDEEIADAARENENLNNDFLEPLEYETKTNDNTLSFEQDSKLVYSAFKKCFNIDLARSSLHWFEFIALLSDIKDCKMNDVIDIRTINIKDVDKKYKQKVRELKQQYAIKNN